jgi:hypothetical protein
MPAGFYCFRRRSKFEFNSTASSTASTREMGLWRSRFQHAQNDYELVIRSAKELEHTLETAFGASGKSIHEKLSSLPADTLPAPLIKQMRFLATIRNKLVHERGFDSIPDRPRFIADFEASVLQLERILKERAASSGASGQQCSLM